MLKIRAVKLEVNTTSGLFGARFEFQKGLNIIRGDNSSGKSSLFQSIIYALGFEELLGGKFEKTMQSALKDQVEYPKDKFHQVLQSYVYLEIENRDIITIRRGVTTSGRKSQLIDVYNGPAITGANLTLESGPMYVHDKGGATDDTYGFHLFLTEFLNWDLPEILNNQGDLTRLYLQQIASSFIIEQKTGWSDFFATMPYYAMRNTESRVIEFILALDVFENEKKKRLLSLRRQQLNSRWQHLYSQISNIAEKTGGKVKGLDATPRIVNSVGEIFIAIIDNDRQLSLIDYTNNKRSELESLSNIEISKVGKRVSENELKLQNLSEKLNQLTLNYEMLSPELSYDFEKLNQYDKQLVAVSEELRKNKGALKIKNLGYDLPAETASNICPTCHQEIRDSLLPVDIHQSTMRIEDNIAYVEAQQKMIVVYLDGQKRKIEDKQNRLRDYENKISETRRTIRSLKQELVQDERLPSIVEIERRLNLKRQVEFFSRMIDNFTSYLEELKLLSAEHEKILSQEAALPKDFFSTYDREKLNYLKEYFIFLLKKLNYQSKPFEAIRISQDTYLPVAQKMAGEQLFYNIKFDSSASDFIRCLWAYFTSLLKTSTRFNSNHPMLLMLDEPKQQDMSIENFHTFLQELSEYKEQQIFVFASFENSDEAFEEATRDVQFSLTRINDKLITPADNVYPNI